MNEMKPRIFGRMFNARNNRKYIMWSADKISWFHNPDYAIKSTIDWRSR